MATRLHGSGEARIASGLRSARQAAPGLALVAALSSAALLVSWALTLPAVLVGLMAGMLFSFAAIPACAPGLAFAGRAVLRLGVALLGAQVTAAQLLGLGLFPILVAVGGLAVSLGLGLLLARRLGLDQPTALLTSASVAICGASAAMAVAATQAGRTSERTLGATVAAITLIGSLAMIAYPMLAYAIGLDARATGVVLGASLHEVVQAVGAGFAHSETAGEVAATVKLVRVACLAPVVILAVWAMRRSAPSAVGPLPPLVPSFLLGFVALAVLASLGAVPDALGDLLRWVSRFCLLMAIVALGMKISPRQLLGVDRRQLAALAGQTLILALFAFAAVWAWSAL